MLRALTIVAVAIGIAFVAWSLLVMTGGRDWLTASRTTETKVADVVADAASKDTKAEAKPAAAPAAEAKPAGEKPAEAKTEAAAEPKAGPEDVAATATPDAAAADAAADAATTGTDAAKPEGEAAGGVDPAGNPAETAKSAEKGSLKSPYEADYAAVAEEGHKKFMAAGCNGCHGGTGGGGMGPPLSNPVWVYGNDGDTLFRLIALGSDGLKEQGYVRKGSENVVGPMPPHGGIVKSNDDLWKIIAWIWSINPPDKKAASAAQ